MDRESGVLSITAAKADPSIKPYINNYEYTSGMINSYYSFSQTYGYFEMSAQLPKGQGFGPPSGCCRRYVVAARNRHHGSARSRHDHALFPAIHSSTGSHSRQAARYKVADMSVGLSHLRRGLAGRLHHLVLRRKRDLEDADACGHALSRCT